MLRWPLNRISIGYRKVVATYVANIEVQGISHRSGASVGMKSQPSRMDASMTLNSTIIIMITITITITIIIIKVPVNFTFTAGLIMTPTEIVKHFPKKNTYQICISK